MKYTELQNGLRIPTMGLGTWRADNGEETYGLVTEALKIGYRLFDTAAFYGNEESVGKAILDSEVDREEVFVTTKVWTTDRGFDTTLDAFDASLKRLGLEYVDLYLIHWPATAKQFDNWKEINAETWRALESLYESGKVKAIGVSNFRKHHLEALLETAIIKPMVNQMEFHPGFTQPEVIAFCKQLDIQVMAWRPLGKGQAVHNEDLMAIAKEYEVTVAQLIIQWIMAKGHIPLPKTVQVKRLKENYDSYNFSLKDEDIARIDKMYYIGCSGLDPDNVDF